MDTTMHQSLNRILIIGYLGGEPEMRYTAVGDRVTAFTIATVRRAAEQLGDGGQVVDWFNVVAWHELAESCSECLHEGSWAYVEGRLQIRSWRDEGGRRQQQAEIVASDVIPLALPRQRPQLGREAVPERAGGSSGAAHGDRW